MYVVSGRDGTRPGGDLTTCRNPSGIRFYLVVVLLLLMIVYYPRESTKNGNEMRLQHRPLEAMCYGIIPGTVWVTLLYQVQYGLQYYTRYRMGRPTTENTYF